MKETILRTEAHSTSGEAVVEIWHRGRFVGAVYAADGCGIRIVSKYAMEADARSGIAAPGVIEVQIKA